MIDNIMCKNAIILNELDNENNTFWFDMKRLKFLHNIDTFYYSVKLGNDFTKDTKDKSCLRFRRYFKRYEKMTFDQVDPFEIKGFKEQLNVRNFTFGAYYNICIECPEMYDIFIAPVVPPGSDDKDSVTSEIIVQIRSYMLWTLGVTKAFERSYDAVKAICQAFGLEIKEVKENRCDYCWHSNYLQNPSQYFRIDNFVKMQVSRYKRIHYEYQFKPNEEYENDYIALGKRSDKCFVRIYLKSKEVIEQGYKAWFLQYWLFHGLINRYDLYVYEECYKRKSWKYLDKARLMYYVEHGANAVLIKECKDILDGRVDKNDDYINTLADKLTPRVTLITNVEYQTTRRSSKSYTLIKICDNSKQGPAERIYDYIDNRKLITEYLTHSTLRLVSNKEDSNKSRAEYTEFWKALRSCKMVDAHKVRKGLKLVRDYTRKLNKQVVKNRFLQGIVTYGLYVKGLNEDDVKEDIMAAMLRLNDNDIEHMKRYKEKKKKLLNEKELKGLLESLDLDAEFEIIRKATGEEYEFK